MSGIIERMQADIYELKRNIAELEGTFADYVSELNAVSQPTRDQIVEQAKDDVNEKQPKTKVFPPYEFVVDNEKRTVVALVRGIISNKVITRGIAKCAPTNCFNEHIGKAIALRRALGLDVPTEYLNAPQPEGVRVGDVVQSVINGFIYDVFLINPDTSVDVKLKYSQDLRSFLDCPSEWFQVIDDSARY